jgi:hypothetical protein
MDHHPEHSCSCANELIPPPPREAHSARAFTLPPAPRSSCCCCGGVWGERGGGYDVVINVAAETRQGQPAALYDTRCALLAKLCAQKAVDTGVPRFIQVGCC